jgi:hypothetical protein
MMTQTQNELLGSLNFDVIAGEWQIITPPQAQASFSSDPTHSTGAAGADNDNSLKREAEASLEEDSRSFKLEKRV